MFGYLGALIGGALAFLALASLLRCLDDEPGFVAQLAQLQASLAREAPDASA